MWEGCEPQGPMTKVLWGLENGAIPFLHQNSNAKIGGYICNKIHFSIELPYNVEEIDFTERIGKSLNFADQLMNVHLRR